MNHMASSNYQSLLFKSDRRGAINTEGYTCYSTFNFGNYQEESRTAFGAIAFVNDVSIAPGNTVYFNRDETIQDIILPVSGSLSYKNFHTHKDAVHPEHILFLDPGTDHAYDIENTYENDWVNYLHIGIKRKQSLKKLQTITHALNLKSENTFVSLNTEQVVNACYGATGVFKGRTKGAYKIKSEGSGIFAYVINGAFEVEDRLMEHRDGLSLLNMLEINFESLSEHGILLLLEIPLEIN